MNEYLSQLYDWISRTDNTFSSRRSRDEFISKMMNEDDYNTQIYDWVSGKDTSFSSRYTTDQFKAKTLANYTPLKKKEESELTSQEVATESITKEAKPPTLSGASKSEFDYESFIEKDEEFALPELENELAGKGYSIEKTGLGDALLVTDNITKEQIEIDLQPISWFGKDKYRKEEIAKVKKLIETPSDVRRKALSANQLEVYSEDRATYINNLKRLYPDIGFDYVQDPSRGALLKVKKGSSVGEFPIAIGTGNDAKQFADINNFLYQNITDDEASSIIKRQNADEYKRIVEEFNKTEDKIDISMESAEADFYGKDYFKGLFKALEQSGVSVPPEAKQELEKGTITRQEYRGNTPISVEVNMGKSQIDSGVQKYFGSNPEVLAKINQYNLSGTVSVRKDKIDRAKKLAIEKFLEDSPDRETTKEILRRVNKDASEEQLRIETNLEMAKSHLEKLVSSVEQSAEQISEKYPKLKVTVIKDEKGNLVDIVSSEPVKEINDIKSQIKDASDVYMSLAYKSKYDYDKVASKAETTGQYIELANKSYDLFDTAMADINNALRQMAGSFEVITTLAEGAIEDVTGIPSAGTVTSGMSAEKRLKLAREGMAESNQKLDQAYKTQRTYQEAIKEGSKFEFATRQFATQAPNIALAIATSGAGSALGMSEAAISTLVATQFGVSSAGQKYDELTTRQEIASIAEKAKKDLETVKGIIPDDEYFAQMYELERAIEDGKITPWQKTLAVTGTGLVEGLVTRYIGTAPNSIKVLKDLKVKPGQFMDDILRSNYKATLGAFKEFGRRTGEEIIEETAIDALTQVNDYAFLGDQIDLSSLDDVAVTSIITSGAMNTPSMAYSTILTQTNVNRYKNKIKSLTGEITTLRDMLSDPDLTNIQRASIHNNINKIISQVADQTTNMEGDALLLGADNIKELMTLSGVRNSMLKKAGVENDDSYDVANAKIDTYLKGVDQKEGKKFVDQMKYIDGRRNDILKSINYEGAVERVFGEKGKEIAKDLDPSLTPQQKYVEVYGQVRQEINDNALKEFKDAIQEQETRDIPDAQRAEGVQEVEGEVREPSVEEKSKTALKISSDTKTALDNKKTKQELTVDENGNTIVNEVEISKEDANLELDRLSLLAEKGRLTVDEFQKSYFGQSTDTNTLSEAKKQIESNPVEFINSIKKGFNETDTEQDVAEKVDERAYKPEEVKETTDAAAFAASQAEAIAQRKDDKLQVTPLTQQDAQKIIDEGGKLFMTEDGKSGAYVTADGYMGGLFKQPGANRTQAAKVLQDARIEAGGKFFDAFGINVDSGKGTNLEDIYIKNGFRPIARMTFNPEFAPKGWEKTNLKNRPDNVFFVYDPTYKATKGEGQRIEDYDQAYELAKNFSPEAAKIEAEVQQLRELFKAPDQRKQVDNALNALSKIAPDVEVIVHESEQAYAEVTNEQGRNQKTAGTYQETEVNGRKRKVIHINPEKANVRTVAHETFHAILLNMVKTDAEARRLTEAMMKAVAKVASPELKAYLDEFASNYDENIQAEEKLAELVGKLASEYSSLPKPTQNIIKRWLDRLAKMFGLKPFTDDQVIDVLNTIAGKVARGEAITESDVSAISEGASTFFSDPTTINKKQVTGEVKVSDTPAELSFVTSKDIIDIDGLVNEISSKGQKVWFWVADQLGRGIYNDTQVGTEHFLDAGPSFALDPKNRAKKAIWATGKGEAEVSKLINKSDYIFIMSGSPIRSKLFNKRVINILKDRVGDYNAFKKGALNAKPTKPFIDVLEGHDSWESLTESPDRKKLLNAIESVKEKKDTPLKTFLQDNNAFIELNDLRDGFYAQNDFKMNDVMLVLKPTAFGGKSDHSTYENDILGEVVGVPNKKVNAYDLMPEDVRQKYSDSMDEAQKSQVVAPYGIGVKEISPRKQFVGVKANLTADQKSSKKKAEDMIKKGMDPLQIKQQTGFEVGVDGKLRLELDASKAKEGFEGLGHSFGKTTVSEALEFPDLIKAYPFIADIPVFFNDGFPSAGLYDGVNIRMNSALINEKGNGDHLGTLLHEIQHVIQIKEGFTGGANPATIRDEVKKAVRNLNNKAINAIQTQVENLTGIRPELTITEGDRKELTEVYENNEAALIDMLSRHTVEDVDAVVKVIRNAENSDIAVENLMEEFGMPNKEAVLLNGIHGVFDMKLYEALSGEVEARNVQNRRTMTEAERRNSLAAETETISQLVSVEDGGKFIDVPIKRSEQIRRKQVANYDNIIKIAKENNISDAAIRQYLSENGITLNEADALLKNYNDRIRKTRQKKEGLFTKDNKVLKILDSIRRKAAREAQRDLNVRRKELADTIKDMKTNGQITTSQSVVIINRISSVNLNNESAVDNLISYVDKVFKNAEYADKIVRSNKKRASAKKNIKSKIGSAKATFNNLNKVFSINARIIPDGVLDTYMELVDQFGARKAVLKLEEVSVVNQKAVDIINAIDTEISEIPKLQQVFDTYPDKKMKDGKIDFTATIEYMVKDGTIQREDADLMNKYKKDILPAEEKVEAEPVEYTFEVKDNNVVDALDKESAQRFLDLVKKHPEALEQLSENEKKNLQGVIDNIEAGFFPSYGNNLSNEIEAIVAKDIVLPRVKNGSRYIFDRLISNVNSLGAKAYRTMFKTNAKPKTATEYSIRANPLSDIDNVLGNMNRTDIYDNVFGKASRSLATLDTEIDIVQEKLIKAEALLNKQHKTGNKVAEAKFRIMAYMLEREYQSNRDSNKVFSAVDALEETIEFHRKESDKSIYSDKDIEILKKILQEFKSRNIDDIYKSFSNRDKQAIELIDKVNTSLSDKALHTASVVRGNRPAMLDNYVHHSVANVDANSLETVTSKYNQFKTFSTKAGTLVERTPGVKALNFDVLNATMKGARETLTDYHMTNTAKTIFKTLNKLKSNILSDKNSTKREIEVANALINSFDTAMRIVFEKSYSPVELGFLNNLKSIGYKALLASVPRAAAELGSNIGYVMITSPVAFTSGYKNYREYVMSQRGRDIMNNLNSEQTGKLYSKKVTGKTADIGLFVNADGISRSSAVNDIQDKANYILSFGKKAINILAEKPAEFLISTPDKAISRPLWFGSLSSKFKELTGNDIDMDAIENNDAAYLRDNKDALDKATIFADKEVTRAATSINVFNGVLKNKINPNDSGTQKVFKEINGFMSNFIIYEYTTMRSGVTALIHSGEISRAEGVRLLAGATARMSMYVMLYQMLSHAFDAAVSAVIGLDIGDDEPEDMNDLFTRQLVGSVLSTMIGKNMGNIAKIGPMMGLEYINENYLQGLRDGKDFDPYKHSMSYSMLSRENIKEISSGRKGFFDVIVPAFSGPYSPMAKTITRGAIVLGRAIEGKKEETRDRAMNELKQRIALEMLGNLGLVPLYKDVRRIVLKDMFKEDEKETGEKPQKSAKYSWEKSQKPAKYSWEK